MCNSNLIQIDNFTRPLINSSGETTREEEDFDQLFFFFFFSSNKNGNATTRSIGSMGNGLSVRDGQRRTSNFPSRAIYSTFRFSYSSLRYTVSIGGGSDALRLTGKLLLATTRRSKAISRSPVKLYYLSRTVKKL